MPQKSGEVAANTTVNTDVVESTEPLKYPSMDALIQSVPKARADKQSTEKG